MSNYIVLQNGERGNKFLLKKELSSITFPIQKEKMDDMLEKQLERESIWCFQLLNQYVLYDAHINLIEVTAPLYVFNGTEKPILKLESYTGLCIAPLDYETAKTKFSDCKDIVTKRMESHFIDIYNRYSLDGGKSCTIHSDDIFSMYIFSKVHEKYIPKEYIKVYEEQKYMNSRIILFIKNQDAKGEVVKIKVEDIMKKAILEDNGKNLERIAKMINASKIEVL